MIYKVQVQQKPVEYFIKADSPEEAQELAKEAQASWNFGYAESFESEILESDLDPRNFQPSKHRHREYILEPKTNDVTYRFVVERGL
jgi:hypothetical protein